MRLGMGLDMEVGGGAFAGVQAFTFQAETTTLATAISPTANRKLWMDRCIRRLKSAGLWTKIRWLNMVDADETAFRTNWKTPAETMTKTGTPTFTADTTVAGSAGQNFYTLPFNVSTLSQNDVAVFGWFQSANMNGTAVLSSSCLGVIDGSSNGFSMAPNSTSSIINMRIAGGSVSTAVSLSDGFGLIGGSRNNSANIDIYYNGVSRGNFASTSAALPALPMVVCGLNNNGTVSNGVATTQAGLCILTSVTATEARALTAIMGEYLETIRYGDYYFEEPGYGTATITKQCLVYGLTGQGVAAAVAIARAGKTVAICGGWRDRFSFGLAGGGLGYTDFDKATSLGGLPRWAITDCNAQGGLSDTPSGDNPDEFKFLPKRFNRSMKKLLKTYSIPVYLTNGVTTITMTGTAATSCRTTDGRTFNFVQWHDGSYEQDFADRVPAISLYKGREAAGAGLESNNGVRDIATSATGVDGVGAAITVDPFNTIGSQASGFLPQIGAIATTFQPGINTFPAVGSADTRTPAYNFRLTFTNDPILLVPLPSTPPTGFVAADFELFIRALKAANDGGNPLTIGTIFKADNLRSSGRYDMNNTGIFSTDFGGQSGAYPTASYAQRETIWKAHWNYIMGLWYVMQYHNDARIPAALRTSALGYGMCADHYYSPHENDSIFHMPQMYIRESQRLVGSVTMTAVHMNQTDGATPTLGDHTVSCASYNMDSHSVWYVAHETSSGVWNVKAEGGMFVNSGGVNLTTPLPYEIFVPKVAECNNGSVSFGGSLTHAAYGSSRMEMTAMQTAYSMGLAHALAIDGDGIIQNVSYATLRTALLASPALSGEVAPVLPQTT